MWANRINTCQDQAHRGFRGKTKQQQKSFPFSVSSKEAENLVLTPRFSWKWISTEVEVRKKWVYESFTRQKKHAAHPSL